MIVKDLGKIPVKDVSGAWFDAYVTRFEQACQHCGEVLVGKSCVDVSLLNLAGSPSSMSTFRAAEDDAFVRHFISQLNAHERRHYFRRAWKWLKKLFASPPGGGGGGLSEDFSDISHPLNPANPASPLWPGHSQGLRVAR